MPDTMHVAIAAGGTAGHINPALALAEELRRRGHELTFFGQPTRLEATLVPQAGFSFVPIEVTGFDRSRPWTLATALWRMHRAQRRINDYFDAHGTPNVAVGFGAYVEMPLLRCCHAKGVACVLHEQNSVPGLANRLLARKVDCVCVSLPIAIDAFKSRVSAQTQIVVTGNPVRQSVIGASREAGRANNDIPDDAMLLLVFGGSLGARHLNDGLVALKDKLLSHTGLYVLHSTGKKDFDRVVAELRLSEEERCRWRVVPYIDAMGEALAAADLVLSRAGASSIAEIAALTVPALLVPYPFATADHQTVNARYLVDAGAAVLLPDDQIDTPAFLESLRSLIDDGERRTSMRQAAKSLAQDRAAMALADQVEGAEALGA